MFVWISRAIILIWILFAVFVLDSGEAVKLGKMVFLLPALGALAIVEFFVWRSRMRASLHAIAGELGLRFEGGLFSSRMEGALDGFQVVLRTEQSNELGKGTCLEVRLDRATGIGCGPKRVRRRLKKAAKDIAALDVPMLASTEVYADPRWAAFVTDGGNRQALEELAERWNGAVLDDRIVACEMRGMSKREEVTLFIGAGLDVARRLRSAT